MTQIIDPLIEYNGDAFKEDDRYNNGQRDTVSALSKSRELEDSYTPEQRDLTAGTDLPVPGTFLVGGALPGEKADGRQLTWLFSRDDAMAWAIRRYGSALVKWDKGQPVVLRPGVLWSTMPADSDPMFWQIRVSTTTSLLGAENG